MGLGLYAVALCMGGAVATAAKMPNPMHRPGGLVFSAATLLAAIWVAHGRQMSMRSIVLVLMCAAAGIAGRLLVPTNPLAVRLLGGLAGKPKGEDSKEAAPVGKEKREAPKDAADAPAEEATGIKEPAQGEQSTSTA